MGIGPTHTLVVIRHSVCNSIAYDTQLHLHQIELDAKYSVTQHVFGDTPFSRASVSCNASGLCALKYLAKPHEMWLPSICRFTKLDNLLLKRYTPNLGATLVRHGRSLGRLVRQPRSSRAAQFILHTFNWFPNGEMAIQYCITHARHWAMSTWIVNVHQKAFAIIPERSPTQSYGCGFIYNGQCGVIDVSRYRNNDIRKWDAHGECANQRTWDRKQSCQ